MSIKGKGRAESVYISAGCNRYSNAADIRKSDGLVAYGAGKLVALWRSEDSTHRGVYATLRGHQGSVTTVKFLHARSEQPICILSGDTTGKVIFWQEDDESKWNESASFTLDGQVSTLASLDISESDQLVAVASSQGYIVIYHLAAEVPQEVQRLPTKNKMPMDIALSFLPNSDAIVMAIGLTDSKIQLATRVSGSSNFAQSIALPGHADWVRCLSFSEPFAANSESGDSHSEYKKGDILLASGSQDNFVRLWRFTTTRQQAASINGSGSSRSALDILDQLDEAQDGEIAAKQYIIPMKHVESEGEPDSQLAVNSESVLLGHDNWITGLHWQQSPDVAVPTLLSASADRSMILWTQDPASGIWLTTHRFGELGGTNLGFFGALWGKDGKTVLAHGWGGSFHTWRRQGDDNAGSWKAQISVSGHFDDVTSLEWEPNGDFLVTVSVDQTARLHAPWRRQDGLETWHELGRPQIHGYDMADIAFLSRMRFISGSEEKIVRVFDAPATFVASMKGLGASATLTDDGSRPNAATVPALGLSNKAVFDSSTTVEANGGWQGATDTLSFSTLQQPPFEEQLLTSTLWPETEKLYGHGYEINAIAGSHDGTLIASACRSANPEHAVIRLHGTHNWAQILPPLAGHNLTITQIRFSPDDKYILSVSRDRSWQLFERQDGGNSAYARVASQAKAHARIIWDCAWSLDGQLFATASRDKQIKIWRRSSPESSSAWTAISTISLTDAATSVAFMTFEQKHVLAVGTEAGDIALYTASTRDLTDWEHVLYIDSHLAHVSTVRRVAWQPSTDNSVPLLASCSDDRSVRVSRIILS